MPTIQALSKQFRQDLLKRDRQAASDLVQAYGEAWTGIKAELKRLDSLVRFAKANGEKIDPRWLYKQNRLTEVLRSVENHIGQFAKYANTKVTLEQANAVRAAESHVQQYVFGFVAPVQDRLIQAGVHISFTRAPIEATQNLIGTFTDGSPLHRVFDSFAGQYTKEAKRALINSFVMGYNPKQTAKMMQREIGGSLIRATTIARTETLRAYRSASLENYQANEDVIKGWRWSASLGRRSCPVCIVMNGTFHSLEEEFGSHPNCRCSPVPVTKSYRELGLDIDEPDEVIINGSEWFAKQDEELQLFVLGKAKFEAYREGKIELSDLVHKEANEQWGTQRTEASLSQALEKAQRRQKKAA